MPSARAGVRRCAIYTRKSSEEGLEQDFNSLHAQREACEAFIASQRCEGWRLIATAYDDGGLSGGTMERPALQRLLSDVRAGKIDTIIVYKVDRLTRSLADFAKMVEVFDTHGVSFVAVTQQFNTTSSMGRLTLNILLSFAQFEREVTGERIRDKIAASKRKGMWMGGHPPLGYAVQDRKLVTVPQEAETVRKIFTRYLALGCVRQLQRELREDGIVSKLWTTANGKRMGGHAFARGALYALLANPIYVGEIRHKSTRHPGQHEPILDRAQFEAVQERLRKNGAGGVRAEFKSDCSVLVGKAFDERGRPLTPSHAVKRGRRYRYYVSRQLLTLASSDVPRGWRLPAIELERTVIAGAKQMLRDRNAIIDVLRHAGIATSAIPTLLKAIEPYGQPTSEAASLLKLVERVDLADNGILLKLSLAPLMPMEFEGIETDHLATTRHVPLTMKRRGVEMRLVIDGGPQISRSTDPALAKALARAHRWFDDLCSGNAKSTAEIAVREGIQPRYVRRLLPLALLAPDVVEAIAQGSQPIELTAYRLTQLDAPPIDWSAQRRRLGFQ